MTSIVRALNVTWWICAAVLAIGTCSRPAYAQATEPKRQCNPVTATTPIAALTDLTSSRTLAVNRDNSSGRAEMVSLRTKLANTGTTVTRLDVTCTVSWDNNVTDYIPQVCDTITSGICTLVDAAVWRKTIATTSKNYVFEFDTMGAPDFECTFSVGAGAGDSGDTITPELELCTLKR